MKRLSHLCLLAALAFFIPPAHGQAPPTASRNADLQVGAGFSWAHSDYVPNNIGGFAFYADYDLFEHYGLEADFHRVRDPHQDALVPSNHFSETTYEIGGRYLRHYDRGRLAPYGKVLYGRGVVNFPAHQLITPGGIVTYIDNIGYNLVSFGGGLDYRLNNRINLRADFEYQHWFASDRELPNGLAPYLFTFGGAYHFPARGPYKMSR
ncbi:MAG TPA: outer membrane beta-barrel protein [Acidobacteriaceae bacterium]|nr:outer membrane beta-barrel protein [Acidobacteriaceae bacterium]